MKKVQLEKKIRLICFVAVACLFSFQTFCAKMDLEAQAGKKLFEGSSPFQSGGPACISCHNVNHPDLIQGGLLAKDLTKVYDRMGEGIAGWLGAPPFPAMVSAYKDHPLSENERNKLMAFFKHANDINKKEPTAKNYSTMLFAGLGGFLLILIWISIVWNKRKKGTVKQSIFDRQSKAYDAKF